MRRSARPLSGTLPNFLIFDALSGCYPGDAVVALRRFQAWSQVATFVGTLEVSPLIFRDQSIEAGADLLPVLDSAGERHRASR